MQEVRRSRITPTFDAAEAVTRLGLIALATDLTSERDARRVVPFAQAALHVTRVAFDNPTTPENLRRMLPRMTEATQLLPPGVPLAAIYYACTAASVEIGDEAVAAAIGAARPGVPVVTPASAALAAFAELQATRIGLITPYLVETTGPMAAFFEANGLELVSAECLGIADDRDMARVSIRTIVEAAEAADRSDADALFLSCTALPALNAVTAIEERLGKPVVTSNQAGFWQMLRLAGVAPVGDAPGILFSHTAPGAVT